MVMETIDTELDSIAVREQGDSNAASTCKNSFLSRRRQTTHDLFSFTVCQTSDRFSGMMMATMTMMVMLMVMVRMLMVMVMTMVHISTPVFFYCKPSL